MIRYLLRFLLLLAMAIIAWWLLAKIDILPSFRDILKSQPVRIAETPLKVEQVRELSELSTYVSIDEVVVDSIRPAQNPLGKLFSNPLGPQQDQLVLVVRGQVKAGVDASALTEADIVRTGDSLSIRLPRATITDVIVNPSGTETFVETGTWNSEAYGALVRKAGEKMRYRAMSEGILAKADARARRIMENLARQSGFTRVSVTSAY
jgi:hypothetical protein